jgi:hypothetical protein
MIRAGAQSGFSFHKTYYARGMKCKTTAPNASRAT